MKTFFKQGLVVACMSTMVLSTLPAYALNATPTPTTSATAEASASSNASPSVARTPEDLATKIASPTASAQASSSASPTPTVSNSPSVSASPSASSSQIVGKVAGSTGSVEYGNDNIQARYESDLKNGKATYGTPGAIVQGNDGAVYQKFTSGIIVDSPTTGTHLLKGGIKDMWLGNGALNSPWGYPTTDEISQNDGNGVTQNFKNVKDGRTGIVTWSNWGTGVHYVKTTGAIGDYWNNKGGIYSFLHYPISEEKSLNMQGAYYQNFESGSLVWTPRAGTVLLYGDIRKVWHNGGGAEKYGVPITNETSPRSGVVEQTFLNANGTTNTAYWSASTGTRFVYNNGAIGSRYRAEGGANSSLGLPVSSENCGYQMGSCYQDFQNGRIVWSPQYGAKIIKGAIREKWMGSGGLTSSPWGVPTTDEILVGNMQVEQKFSNSRTGQNGAVYWTNQGTGTHYVKFSGAIGSYWRDNGNYSQAGTDTPKKFGFPIGDEVCANGYCHQKFQYGQVTWDNYGGGTGGFENQKCQALNDGRSKYSAQGAKRVSLALAPRYANYRKDWGGTHGTFYNCLNLNGSYVLNWKTSAAFGESGFLAPWKRIYDAQTGALLPAGVTGNTAGAYTPTGSYSFSNPFGVGNPGTKLASKNGYHTIQWNSRWGGDPNTWYYNTYIQNGNLGYPNENMQYFANMGDYEQGVLINYNKSDDGTRTLSGTAGFAIMLHTTAYNTSVADTYTWGCIAIDRGRIYQFLREADANDRIIMGVESEVMNW